MKNHVIVIGAGIVGLATAYQLAELRPGVRITVLEKEKAVAVHQTGRNSGVLHSGIYYRPGSIRAQNCQAGKGAMEAFCEREGIPFERCGKLIVAINEAQRPALKRIYERGQANGVDCRMISAAEIREVEPYCAGIAGIHVPESGIVDYTVVCRRLAEILGERVHDIRLGCRVTGIHERAGEVVVETPAGEITADVVVNCTGLFSDRTAAMAGVPREVRIVPFRGEYFELRPEATHLCRGLIYPVPDPRFPFLGVHFTKMIGGGVECGPNAVLAFAREGYGKTDINPADLWDSISYIGFRRLARKYWRTGVGEMWRSVSKAAFVRSLQALVPEIRAEHLETAPSGVRAQAVTPAGELVDDFKFHQTGRTVHVLNAASPAATAALNVGEIVAEKAEKLLIANR